MATTRKARRNPRSVRLPEIFTVRVPSGMPEALAHAARRNRQSTSAFTRQALSRALLMAGVYLRDGSVRFSSDWGDPP